MLSQEADCAFKTIQSHPAIVGGSPVLRPGENGAFEISFKIQVSMPTRSKQKGISKTGVKAQETVTMCFPKTYPFRAPMILLGRNFNSTLPHIYPLISSDKQGNVVPCVYDGPLEDLLHQEEDGLSKILDQLSEWLKKAAVNDLIDSNQGWEPIRRDNTFGWLVYDISELKDLVQDKAGALAFRCRVLLDRHQENEIHFFSGIDYQKTCEITPFLIQNSFFEENRHPFLYISMAIFVWSDLGMTADGYLAETIFCLHDLYERAREYGCYDQLKDIFVSLGAAIKKATPPHNTFYVPIILCARRPCNLIGDTSPLEIIPYMAQLQVEKNRSPFGEAAVRFSNDSPVYPIGHRHAITSKLLRQMSGGKGELKHGNIVHIGCGSVGSKIAVHLARSGQGPFKLIDKGFFSPHNVARHALMSPSEIAGYPKAVLLAEQIKTFQMKAEPFTTNIASLCFDPESKKKAFPEDTQLIIESTGSMAVREMLAALPPEKFPGRILHAALYNLGQMGIMALEGQNRNPNLSDLVVRYYDLGVEDKDIRKKFQDSPNALIRQSIGHGCGSHTMVMPDTRISLYTAGMAERARQVLENNNEEKGELWIGRLESNEIQVNWRHINVGQTDILKIKASHSWEIRILDIAADQIEKEVAKYENIETGGVLMGKISLPRRCITISSLIEAPPDSNRSQSSFILGTSGLKEKVLEIFNSSGGYLNYVGTWHSHPNGGGPSSLDRACLERLKKQGLGAPAVGLIWTPAGFKTILDEGKLS